MRLLQITQAIKVTVVALLAFVLVFAPVSHSIAMPSGHMTSKMADVDVGSKSHHQTAKADTKSQSNCGDSTDQSKAEKNCCEVGCLSIANINGASGLFVASFVTTQHLRTEQQLHSRIVSGLKRPPRI